MHRVPGHHLLLLLSLSALAGCGAPHPTIQSFLIENDRPDSVWVQARCSVPEVHLLRARGTEWEPVRYQQSFCGTCACDGACDCPPCEACTNAPAKLAAGARHRVIWSGEELSFARAEGCGNRCLQGAEVPRGRYRVRVCYSPFGYTSDEAADGSRTLACVEREFDPFATEELKLNLAEGAWECSLDEECSESERCNLSTMRRSSGGALFAGSDGEGLCRRRCEDGCVPGTECRTVRLVRDEQPVTAALCFPK